MLADLQKTNERKAIDLAVDNYGADESARNT